MTGKIRHRQHRFAAKRIVISAAGFFFLCAAMPLSGLERALSFGGKNGWQELAVKKNITSGMGRFGYEAMQLAAVTFQPDEFTDLLIGFEDSEAPQEIPADGTENGGFGISDAAGNYEVVSSSLILSEKTRFGKSAGVSRGISGGLVLKGTDGTLFGTEGPSGSFTIEFWLMPSLAENGETVFSWRSSKKVQDVPQYQTITASFFGNRLSWSFVNVFSGEDSSENTVELTGYKAVIPNQWAHHTLVYNENISRLEYYVDSSLEAIVYVTENKREGGKRLDPVFGIPAAINWCPHFTGSIDEIRIERSAAEQRLYDRFNAEGGRFETMPVETSGIGAELTGISSITQMPPQTAIQLFVRSGDNIHLWAESPPEWVPLPLNGPITDVSGRYFQLAAELYPDGLGLTTPAVTEIIVRYTEKHPPVPPFAVRAAAGDGEVTLTWSAAADSSAGGYFVYYGERPGEYLGQSAAEGVSPVDAGNTLSYKLTGLTNGKIYYFAVASYAEQNKNLTGGFSKEVYARPLPDRNAK
ncbi:MAG: hypothetical protein NC041_09765 [Bacteroides sp.]|nr:hypothetical protein [Prevotella sp.]MCM1408548.1 hypothetical protein [Treponema brennaborense]MCM1470738.1 hypothetical protein [Bacteroides sp.]